MLASSALLNCSITASSARLRSVKSRVTFAYPVTSPLLSRMAVRIVSAQKREPSLRTRQPSSSTRPSGRGQAHQLRRPASLHILLREEPREMQPLDLFRRVPLDALRARIPGHHAPVAIQQVDGVIAHALHNRAKLLIVVPQGLQRCPLLRHIAHKTQHDGARRRSPSASA